MKTVCAGCGYTPIGHKPEGWRCGECERTGRGVSDDLADGRPYDEVEMLNRHDGLEPRERDAAKHTAIATPRECRAIMLGPGGPLDGVVATCGRTLEWDADVGVYVCPMHGPADEDGRPAQPSLLDREQEARVNQRRGALANWGTSEWEPEP